MADDERISSRRFSACFNEAFLRMVNPKPDALIYFFRRAAKDLAVSCWAKNERYAEEDKPKICWKQAAIIGGTFHDIEIIPYPTNYLVIWVSGISETYPFPGSPETYVMLPELFDDAPVLSEYDSGIRFIGEG